ncbi:MAG: hypothetical protein ACRCTS_07240 [Fusobacteriaceae bacterium]
MKKSVVKKNNDMVEKITISTETIEYDYSYEENDLVHLEMNLIELPFFNKNSKIKKNTSIIYNFNKDKSSYLQVKPGYNMPIPGEKEEKIFYALLKILQKNNFLQSNYCYTDYYEIIKEMELSYSGKNKEQVRKGLEILRETHYEFQNSFYTNTGGEHHRVSFNELKKLLNIAFITFDKTTSEEEQNLFTNNKKEIIRIELSDFIKHNILNKIFLYFSKQDLMSLENAVTRNLWIKLTKWRNGTLFLKVSSKNIATKIPLSWTPSTYSKTIIIIKKALEDLKEKNLLKHYEFVNTVNGKKIPNEKSYFEIKFDESHNEKRNNFSMGKLEINFPENYDTSIEGIEYSENLGRLGGEISDKTTEPSKESVSDILVDELFSLLNENGKKLSTMRSKIEKFLKKNSFEEIRLSILYTNKNAKKSYGKYFTDTLENRWYEEFQQNLLKEEEKEKEKEKKSQKAKENNQQLEFEKDEKQFLKDRVKNSYENLSEEKKIALEKLALEEYISQGETPGEKKSLKDFFKKMKAVLISDYLIKNNYFELEESVAKKSKPNSERGQTNENMENSSAISSKEHIESDIIVQTNIVLKKATEADKIKTENKDMIIAQNILNKKEIGKILNENADAAAIIYGLEENKVLELKFEVARAAISKENVTEDFIIKKIDEIIKSW